MMARVTAVSLAVLALLGLCCASDDPTVQLTGVTDLTADTFAASVNGAKAALVEFYAPWCGHCKRLVPEYKKLGELVQADPKLKNRVLIAKVDADAHRSVGDQFGVRGFPSIKFFPRGVPPSKSSAKDYAGARTAEAFISYLQQELEADAGFARVEVLQELVAGFTTATDPAAVVAKVSAQVAELAGDDKVNGEVYVKVLQKAAEKGASYLTKERARLDKMLSGGSLSAAKLDELSRKLSVINAILGDDATEQQ